MPQKIYKDILPPSEILQVQIQVFFYYTSKLAPPQFHYISATLDHNPPPKEKSKRALSGHSGSDSSTGFHSSKGTSWTRYEESTVRYS